ncbi:carbohydrate porin [Marinomonas sp. C1424]|uniref:Carbohydrate porin n=2 Tax=Marinomonas transparens TaxID=2795388 RepID=A0A934N125_9GAMM|nr:carbohydrate porin [Marinomonas transparens]
MKKTTLYTAIVSSMLSAGIANAAPTMSANIELNTDVYDKSVSETTYEQDGRVELTAYNKHTSGDNFIEGKGAIELKVDNSSYVADVYAKIGNSKWDVQVGHFEAINLFPKGKDTLVSNAGGVAVYEANLARGRADDGGQIALHFAPSDSLKIEIGTIYGDDDTNGDNKAAFSGIRPIAILSTDAATFTAGYESVKYDLAAGGDVSKTGYSIGANFDVSSANVNVAMTHLKDDSTGVDKEVDSFVINMTAGNFGLGLISSTEDNAGSETSVMTAYTAYTMPVFDIENASVTLAASYSTADDVAASQDDEILATRVRINYTF